MIVYKEVFKRRGMGKLLKNMPSCHNIYQIKEYLDSLGVTETSKVTVIKEIFDVNLQDDYKNIVAYSGMDGYWALIYDKMFSLLGYDTSLYELIESNIGFDHTVCRIKLHTNTVDITRDRVIIGVENVQANKVESKSSLYSELMEYGKLKLKEEVYSELSGYAYSITKGNIDTYNSLDLRGICGNDINYKILIGEERI